MIWSLWRRIQSWNHEWKYRFKKWKKYRAKTNRHGNTMRAKEKGKRAIISKGVAASITAWTPQYASSNIPAKHTCKSQNNPISDTPLLPDNVHSRFDNDNDKCVRSRILPACEPSVGRPVTRPPLDLTMHMTRTYVPISDTALLPLPHLVQHLMVCPTSLPLWCLEGSVRAKVDKTEQ